MDRKIKYSPQMVSTILHYVLLYQVSTSMIMLEQSWAHLPGWQVAGNMKAGQFVKKFSDGQTLWKEWWQLMASFMFFQDEN